jgi:uncharacterized surface anchored protein
MRTIFVIALLVSVLPIRALADTRGVIGGRVVDPQGAAVAQAIVELKNTIDGRRQETTTDDQGMFEFRFVELGDYRITVTAAGFSVMSVRAVVSSS